jgi:predicted enzyme related to lactoylglutathione lyase
LKTEGLIEVILYVQDMHRQVTFYRDIIGLEITYPAGLRDYTGENWVTFATGGCSLALHSGGQGRQSADTPMIVFGVEDIQSAWRELQAKGLDIGQVFSAAPGVWVAHAKDPEGNPIAIEQHDGIV